MNRFNLLQEAWIPVKGRSEHIKVCEIVKPEIMELDAPRPDFNAALMQFLIGILQTIFVPKNPREWRKYYDAPPTETTLQKSLDTIKNAFYLDGDGPRFMQDVSIKKNGNKADFLKLIPALVGADAIKNNKDFFLKSSQLSRASLSNLSIALYLYQNYCLSETGGKSGRHHGSFRGRNSILSLVVQKNGDLWKNLWLNIIEKQKFESLTNNRLKNTSFLWVDTKPYDKEKSDADIMLTDLYWSMPRRVYVDFLTIKKSICDISHISTETIENIYIKENGIDYKTKYIKHPLIPYNKSDDAVVPVKLNALGINYGDWLSLIGSETASINLLELQKRNISEDCIVFACGYLNHATQAKTLCWYETKLPLYNIVDKTQRELVESEIKKYVQASAKIADLRNGYLVNSIKFAWFDFNNKKNTTQKANFKSHKAIEISKAYWNQTHDTFYRLVDQLYSISVDLNTDSLVALRQKWYLHIISIAEKVFNQWAFKSGISSNPRRISDAYNQLMNNLNSKSLKNDTLSL